MIGPLSGISDPICCVWHVSQILAIHILPLIIIIITITIIIIITITTIIIIIIIVLCLKI